MIEIYTESELNTELNKNKFNFVYISANWCDPCKKISPEIFNFENEYTNINFFKINIENIDDIIPDHNVNKIPFYIYYIKNQMFDFYQGTDLNIISKKIKNMILQK